MINKSLFVYLVFFLFTTNIAVGQSTQIRGFADVTSSFANDKVSFGFDEQDLFITATINDRISFLGETVFKFTESTPTEFSVSVERLIIKYNLKGNNDIIMGKIHTPLNYWNDSYHHGRVFFPTIFRPLLFSAGIIPIHTAGVGIQGHDLGNAKFGYDFFIGNGLGSAEIADNDKSKSVTAAVHVKPADRLRLGLSWYHDVISEGAEVHNNVMDWQVNQNLFTVSASRFGKKLELLAEGTLGINKTDTTGSKNTWASYVYAGYRVTDKWVPYIRYDNVSYQQGEIYYNKNNTSSFTAGIRYEISYLAVVKLEYEFRESELSKDINAINLQFAVGF